MQLFFIPGFGEEPSIFDKIKNHFPENKTFINNWDLVGDEPRPDLNVLQYARELVKHFDITANDTVIGHSMGGWIAWHIKHLTGCRTIQIASWTDSKKVVLPVSSPEVIYWLAKSGLYLNPITRQIFLWRNYYKKPSAEIYLKVFNTLIKGNKENVLNQLRVILNPVSEKVTVKPDLRIHSKADTTILFPDEPTVEVPGDHFNLWTHPGAVYAPILDLIANPVGSS